MDNQVAIREANREWVGLKSAVGSMLRLPSGSGPARNPRGGLAAWCAAGLRNGQGEPAQDRHGTSHVKSRKICLSEGGLGQQPKRPTEDETTVRK